MSNSAVITSEARGVEDGADERLLDEGGAGAARVAQGAGLLSVKSSKKVKLPAEEEGSPAVGAGRFTIGPAPEPDWDMVPPDGKWGWCVLVGATLVNILIPGTIKSFGVLLVEFNEVFSATQSESAPIVAVCYFLYSSLGPLSSILSVKWSYRTVTLIGGSFAAFGMIFSSWAFSITYLYFSFGFMVGTGAGLAFPPTVYIVTSYFSRLRGLANGICMSGSAFGSIILPPVLRYLLETYGYKGAVLILGGIMLNVWAAALLFQPVEQHMVRQYKTQVNDPDGPQGDTLYEEEEPIENYNMTEKTSHLQNERVETVHDLDNKTFKNKAPEERIDSKKSSPIKEQESPERIVKNNSQNVIQIQPNSSAAQLRQNLSRRKLSYTRPSPKYTYSSNSITNKLGSQDFSRRSSVALPKRNLSTSSFAYVSTPFHGSTLSAFERPNEFASQFSLKSITESVSDVAYCCFCCRMPRKAEERSKFFDVTLLTDPAYLVILISSSTVAISCTNFIILLPSYADNIGFDKARGAYLLSTVSALDLVGRIGGSALCDLNFMPKSFFFVGGLFFSGICLVVITFLSSYTSISIVCACFGLASGINNSVTTLVMAEILGVDRLMSTYGISLFVNGLLQLVGPPICGYWFEKARNYYAMFMTFGFIFIFGSSLWILMPFINRYKRRKENEKLEPFPEEEPDLINPRLLLTPEEMPCGDKANGSPPLPNDEKTKSEPFIRSASAALMRSHDVDKARKITPASSRHGLQHIGSKVSNNLTSNSSFLESVPEGKTGRAGSTEAVGRKLTVPKTPKRSPSTSSFQYMSTPFHGSTLSAFEKPSEFASQFSIKSVTDSLAPMTHCCGFKKKLKKEEKTEKKEPRKYFDVQLLKDPIYLVILISNCTCAISYTNFIIYVPSYAKECGFDKSLGAYLLSIISALDLVGRIGGSALSDLVPTPKRYFFITGLLLSGISLAIMPVVTTYSAISAFCSIFGIASGINVGVTALVMTEMLGTERLMSSYGISLFMNGILQLVGPSICGVWIERAKSHRPLFVTLGIILIFGASLWLLVPIINRRRRNKSKKGSINQS